MSDSAEHVVILSTRPGETFTVCAQGWRFRTMWGAFQTCRGAATGSTRVGIRDAHGVLSDVLIKDIAEWIAPF